MAFRKGKLQGSQEWKDWRQQHPSTVLHKWRQLERAVLLARALTGGGKCLWVQVLVAWALWLARSPAFIRTLVFSAARALIFLLFALAVSSYNGLFIAYWDVDWWRCYLFVTFFFFFSYWFLSRNSSSVMYMIVRLTKKLQTRIFFIGRPFSRSHWSQVI